MLPLWRFYFILFVCKIDILLIQHFFRYLFLFLIFVFVSPSWVFWPSISSPSNESNRKGKKWITLHGLLHEILTPTKQGPFVGPECVCEVQFSDPKMVPTEELSCPLNLNLCFRTIAIYHSVYLLHIISVAIYLSIYKLKRASKQISLSIYIYI